MTPYNIMILTLESHHVARYVFRELVDAGINVRTYSVIGKDGANSLAQQSYTRSTLWGELAHALPDRTTLTLPVIGSVAVLGHLVTILASVIETLPGPEGADQALSPLGAALFHYGLPRESAVNCEIAVSANRVLVIGYGTTEEIVHAGATLRAVLPGNIVMHEHA
ncbi:hypothetical protein VSR69_44385 [Paraburkholderia phytofirmans]